MSNTEDQEFENEVAPEQVDDTATEESTDFENTTEEVETVEDVRHFLNYVAKRFLKAGENHDNL